jgi:translation initiation factor 1
MSRKKQRKSKNGTDGLTQNPFDELAELTGLVDSSKTLEDPTSEESPSSPDKPMPVKTSRRGQKNMNRGRVDIVRQTAHRGGKAVTVAKNFKGIALAEKKELAKKIQKACGVGGTVKDGCIEIQGDNREEMMRILTEAGFNPVFAGG